MRSAKNIVFRWSGVLVPILGVTLLRCTLGGLNALGEGSPDASLPRPGGPLVPGDAGPDGVVSLDPGDSSVSSDTGVSSPPALSDASPSDALEAEGAALDGAFDANDAMSAVPPSALPIWLDAGAASWCDSHPTYAFCADFDKTPLPAGFNASDGPYLVQTSSLPSSGPNDLLLYVPSQTGGGTWGSKLSKPFATPASSLVLEFDFNPESLNVTSSGILFAALDFTGNTNAQYSIRLAYNAGAPRLEESLLVSSVADIFHSNFAVPLQTWSRIHIEITFPEGDGGTATETISVNGVVQGVAETLSPPSGFDQRPTLLIGGVFGTNPTNGWALRYDNVTLDIK